LNEDRRKKPFKFVLTPYKEDDYWPRHKQIIDKGLDISRKDKREREDIRWILERDYI
jgi:hypothetical protein